MEQQFVVGPLKLLSVYSDKRYRRHALTQYFQDRSQQYGHNILSTSQKMSFVRSWQATTEKPKIDLNIVLPYLNIQDNNRYIIYIQFSIQYQDCGTNNVKNIVLSWK